MRKRSQTSDDSILASLGLRLKAAEVVHYYPDFVIKLIITTRLFAAQLTWTVVAPSAALFVTKLPRASMLALLTGQPPVGTLCI